MEFEAGSELEEELARTTVELEEEGGFVESG